SLAAGHQKQSPAPAGGCVRFKVRCDLRLEPASPAIADRPFPVPAGRNTVRRNGSVWAFGRIDGAPLELERVKLERSVLSV
ncbi:hypothetical protein ABTE16_20965, partial [Acinetobacter baumannii]